MEPRMIIMLVKAGNYRFNPKDFPWAGAVKVTLTPARNGVDGVVTLEIFDSEPTEE